MRMKQLVAASLFGLAGVSCKVDIAADVQGALDDAQNAIDDLIDEIGMRVEAQDTFTSRIVLLGEATAADGSQQLYVHGATSGGGAITTEAFAEMQIYVDGELVHGCRQVTVTATVDASVPAPLDDADAGVSDGGAAEPPAAVPEPETVTQCEVLAGVSIRGFAELEGPLFSVSIVNDYSGSMSDSDIRLVAGIHDRLFRALPEGLYEAEVVRFSSDVDTLLPFSEDEAEVLEAVRADEDYLRRNTALYDGMGTGLESLLMRDLPVRILMVSSDGHENSSDMWTRSELQRDIADGGVVTVILGSGFADVDELRGFAGSRGVFFYAPFFDELSARVVDYVESIADGVEITLPPELAGQDVELRVGDVSLSP